MATTYGHFSSDVYTPWPADAKKQHEDKKPKAHTDPVAKGVTGPHKPATEPHDHKVTDHKADHKQKQ